LVGGQLPEDFTLLDKYAKAVAESYSKRVLREEEARKVMHKWKTISSPEDVIFIHNHEIMFVETILQQIEKGYTDRNLAFSTIKAFYTRSK
jgi:hypothetical protein